MGKRSNAFAGWPANRWLGGAAACAAMLALQAPPAAAESTFASAASGAFSASARVDVRIKIAKVLFLRIGSGSAALGDSGTINSIYFNLAAADVGSGAAEPAVGSSGDLGGGAVTVRVFANGGNQVILSSATSGPLLNASSDSIAWSEIDVAAAPLSITTSGYSNGAIVHPAFHTGLAGGASPASTLLTGAAGVVRVEGKWTFSYANSNPVPAGTYGVTVAQNGRVTYTATQP